MVSSTGLILIGPNPNGTGLIEYEISGVYPLIVSDGPYKVRIDAYYPRPDDADDR